MNRTLASALSAILVASWSFPATAQRQPVLRQIDLPHPYYYREMYLPQLTSGPSSLAWSPDSQQLVYSMAGRLWRQSLQSHVARQLTASSAYDYQPDWSPDGRWIVYSSYRNDAVELWLLEVASGATRPLLQNRAVNVEPRFSPDGSRVAFVSTMMNGHFHVFSGEFTAGKLSRIERLTGEHTSSDLPRYYYSPVDHEISPIWSRDGKEILYVSNRNHIYGTGGFWRMAAQPGAPAREIHYEETNWRARPEFSPDGNRLVYASYVGRSWHNLWVLPGGGGDAFPIAYGDWDQVNPRWSPDGTRIAFIANKAGDTEIDIMPMPGGEMVPLHVGERQHLKPTGRLHIQLHSNAGAAAARVSVTDSIGMFYAPADAWIHADDGFDRQERSFEAHYFHLLGDATLELPAGAVRVEIMQGFERRLEHHDLNIGAGQTQELTVSMDEGRFAVPAPGRWVSGDLHVHMNYGGVYRNTPAHLVTQARAENLQIIESLIVNKEQRYPDMAYRGLQEDPASRPDALVMHGQEFHTSYWGHLGLLIMKGGVILPGYVGYPNTAASSLYPSNADVADLAHAKQGLVGYVHPFDAPPHPFNTQEKLTDELPIDVALGKVDYIEALGFSDHLSTAGVWYRLLNLGFRIPAGAGTDAMADFASLRGPVGMNRVYVRMEDGDLDATAFGESLRRGRTFATNGPLLGFTLGGASIGDELHYDREQQRVVVGAHLRSIVPVGRLELVCNGRVVRSFIRGKAIAEGDFTGSVDLKQSGWCLLRAATDGASYPVLDNYVFATTSPVYVDIGHRPPHSREDADYFVAWIDRVTESTAAYPDWNSAAEKTHVMGQLSAARTVYLSMR